MIAFALRRLSMARGDREHPIDELLEKSVGLHEHREMSATVYCYKLLMWRRDGSFLFSSVPGYLSLMSANFSGWLKKTSTREAVA
jgi:hypothetical protein